MPGDLIADLGAVSEPVARMMAEGALENSNAHVCGGDHRRRRPRRRHADEAGGHRCTSPPRRTNHGLIAPPEFFEVEDRERRCAARRRAVGAEMLRDRMTGRSSLGVRPSGLAVERLRPGLETAHQPVDRMVEVGAQQGSSRRDLNSKSMSNSTARPALRRRRRTASGSPAAGTGRRAG